MGIAKLLAALVHSAGNQSLNTKLMLCTSFSIGSMADVEATPSQQASQDAHPPPPNTDAPPSKPTITSVDASFPAASLADNGLSKRPRDARLIHMVLANLGVTSYQERVPLQLMDFAYRYTSSTLQDALHLTTEGYGSTAPTTGKGAGNDLSTITMASLRLGIASRTHYQFSPTLPKEFYHEIAAERNRIALPTVGRDWGVRLPPEQYCLTGVGWGLKEEWASEGEAEGEQGDEMVMDGQGDEEEGNEDEEGNERMEDIFGEDVNGGDGDRDMEDG